MRKGAQRTLFAKSKAQTKDASVANLHSPLGGTKSKLASIWAAAKLVAHSLCFQRHATQIGIFVPFSFSPKEQPNERERESVLAA